MTLKQQIEEILEEILISHLTDDQSRFIWKRSEITPYTDLDYVQEFFAKEISQATEQILQIKCKYCPYIKVISFTPDSELAKKVIDEQRQEIEKLNACLAQIRERIE